MDALFLKTSSIVISDTVPVRASSTAKVGKAEAGIKNRERADAVWWCLQAGKI
jgi:hypothetical protein